MSYSIPCKALGEGAEVALRNVDSLVETASLLHDNERFLHSAVFSLLAMEEMMKAELLTSYYEKRIDLPLREWKRLTYGASAHKKKLREYVIGESRQSKIKTPNGVSIEQIIEMIVEYHVRLKQQVLYVNWDGRIGKWQWFPGQYDEKEKKEISARLLKGIKKRSEKCKLEKYKFVWPKFE